MGYILGISGRKQSGKDSSADFLIRNRKEFFPISFKVEKIALADKLKEFCIDILGLTYEQCYGTNEQKNSLTKLRWEDLPHYNSIYFDMFVNEASTTWTRPSGFMTARAVLQQVGSEIFRKMYSKVWVDACLREITKRKLDLALITDVRFPDEVEGIKGVAGKVIRLTRTLFPDDKHISENALNDYTDFDFVVDNHDKSIQWKERQMLTIVTDLGWANPLS
jgi:hypothetical protein